MANDQVILFTAFEPSGDALAAPLIARLLRERPGTIVWALGGPKMQAAGARLIEPTTQHAVMLLGVVSQAMAHRRRLQRLAAWLDQHPVTALVPVDSPAANWSICKLVRGRQPDAKIVHLAAPQLWAWAPWRIRKLRRLTDHVLCLLPFEPEWFSRRGVPATFVGHPLFDPPESLQSKSFPWADGAPKIAVLPGSRAGEVRANGPTMLRACVELKKQHPGLRAVVAAVDQAGSDWVRSVGEQTGGWPGGVEIAVGQTDAVLEWSDVALVVSGTATLQTVVRRRPMVVMYNVGRLTWWLLGPWLIKTRTFSLPNLIAEASGWGRVVPELVPHFGAVDPVAREMDRLIRDPRARDQQVEASGRIAGLFSERSFAQAATDQLLRVIPVASSKQV